MFLHLDSSPPMVYCISWINFKSDLQKFPQSMSYVNASALSAEMTSDSCRLVCSVLTDFLKGGVSLDKRERRNHFAVCSQAVSRLALRSTGASKLFHTSCPLCVHSKCCKTRQQRAMFAKPLFWQAEVHNRSIRKTKKIYQKSLLEKRIISEFVFKMRFFFPC